MAKIVVLLILGFSLLVHAESIFDRKNVDSIPKGLTPNEEQEWKMATCKWRIVNDDDHVGMGGWGSSKGCFAQARTMMIVVDQDSRLDADTKKAYRNDLLIIFTDHEGHQEVCHSIPVKDVYDKITMDDFAKDVTENGGEPSDPFLNHLNDNVQLQCLMM